MGEEAGQNRREMRGREKERERGREGGRERGSEGKETPKGATVRSVASSSSSVKAKSGAGCKFS